MEINKDVYDLIELLEGILPIFLGYGLFAKRLIARSVARSDRGGRSIESWWFKLAGISIKNCIQIDVVEASWTSERK